jgi:2'-5' RNA ligase
VRTFVAVFVPELVPLPGLPDALDRPARHCTLRFLGEVGSATVEQAGRALGDAASWSDPFRVTWSRIGAFPNWKRPRVVFVEAATGRTQLESLAGAVNTSLEAIGLPREPRPFVPHVTLLRVRSSADGERARRLAEAAGDRVLGETMVEEVCLVESELLPSGARHHVLGRYPLGLRGSG